MSLKQTLLLRGIEYVLVEAKLFAFDRIGKGRDWDLWYEAISAAITTVQTNKTQRDVAEEKPRVP